MIPGLTNGREVGRRLNDASIHVAAQMDRDVVVVRPTSQPTIAGMAVHYGGRPQFRGKVIADDGRPILVGAVERSMLPATFSIVGGLLAAVIAVAGVMLLLSGDVSGIAALLFGALTGLAVFANTVLIQRLSRIDEATIKAALAAISESS